MHRGRHSHRPHLFAGDTADVSSLPGVLEDLHSRFGMGCIPVVADRGLISVNNVDNLAAAGSTTCSPPVSAQHRLGGPPG